MAQAYAKVLAAMELDFAVIGRGAASAAAFREATGIPVVEGGIAAALAASPAPARAIVATGIESLSEITLELLRHGTSALLVEKPVGLTAAEVEKVAAYVLDQQAEVFVAYNRRFFASVAKARDIIAEDGGVQSISFEFTELADRVAKQDRLASVKERWLVANSTHVIDLALHLAGAPKDWQAFHCGALEWHPSAAVFSGAGTTDGGTLFSYSANWNGPGRWGLEIVTGRRRLTLRPMEKLFVTEEALKPPVEHPLDAKLDEQFKPGLYAQVQAFLHTPNVRLCGIQEHSEMMHVYERIGGYP